jgi:valacyclovir hydrolase
VVSGSPKPATGRGGCALAWFEHGPSRIYYEEAGSGDPVLLLPGFSDTIASHARLREALEKRYRVIAADLPGSGRSGPQPRVYGASDDEEDAATFTAFLRQRGAVPAHLLGFSSGGEIALLMASLAPDVARSVVTWGASGFVSDPDGQIRESFRGVIDHPVPATQEYRDYLVATYGEDIARAMTQNFAGALDAIIAAGGDISRSRAHTITCAVMLIFGERDFLAPRTLVEALASQIETAEVVEAEGAGHGVHVERPEWFVNTVVEWLAKQ